MKIKIKKYFIGGYKEKYVYDWAEFIFYGPIIDEKECKKMGINIEKFYHVIEHDRASKKEIYLYSVLVPEDQTELKVKIPFKIGGIESIQDGYFRYDNTKKVSTIKLYSRDKINEKLKEIGI